MYKMMVVDDEAWVRERLVHTFDWEALGIEVVGEAGNGEEALPLLELLKPDLMLTDIRMPQIDGLELLEYIKEQRIPTKVIMITGHSDFHYAKKSISYGAFEYVLKPVEDEELLGIVKRCLEQIAEERKKDTLFDKVSRQMQMSLPILRDHFYANLVHGLLPNDQEIYRMLDQLGIRQAGLNHLCIILMVRDAPASSDSIQIDLEFARFVLTNLAKDLICEISDQYGIVQSNKEVICIVSSPKPGEELTQDWLQRSETLQRFVNKILSCQVIISTGQPGSCFKHIPQAYRQAEQAIILNGLLHDALPPETTAAAQQTSKPRLRDTEVLLNQIKLGQKEEALLEVNKLFQEQQAASPEELRFVYISIINTIMRSSMDSAGSTIPGDFSLSSLRYFELLQNTNDMQETHRFFEAIVLKLIDLFHPAGIRKKRNTIDQIIQYIHEHYMEDLTLNRIADRFHINASYLSKMFKDEVGISFIKYVTEFRIRKAIEWMGDSTLKIYEIAANVGYEDVQYFTKLFKSITGVTPMQYKERVR